jgi:hypothetical protein
LDANKGIFLPKKVKNLPFPANYLPITESRKKKDQNPEDFGLF